MQTHKSQTSLLDILPDFPAFEPINPSMQDAYNAYYSQFPPYSDFSFGNLVIWLNQFGDLSLSKLNGNLIYKYTNLFMDEIPMISMLGVHEIDKTIRTLLDFQVSLGHPPEVSMIPEIVKVQIQDYKGVRVEEEPGNANYILDTAKLTTLEGATYGKLRRQINHFKSDYQGRYEVRSFDIADLQSVHHIINSIHLWDALYSHNDQERQESRVINTTLSYAEALNFKALAVLVDGKIEALTIYQVIPQTDYVIGNHTKANTTIKNIFNFTVHSLASLLSEQGISYINFEQDLGIEGLAEHKRGLRPINFLRHYRVELD